MLTESEQRALDQIREYLAAGRELSEIRAAGWENWIDHLEDKGVDLRTGEIRAQPPDTAATERIGAERLGRLSFYLRNAIVSLFRSRQRAMFAIGSVAVGVAAIVALQLTADVIEHKLTTNVREVLRGDLVSEGLGGDRGVASVQALQDEGLIDGFTTSLSIHEDTRDFLAHFKAVLQGRTDKNAVVNQYMPIFLEKDVYPYYGRVRADKPAGRDLWYLVQDPYDVVVTSTVANRHNINVDDQFKLGQIQELFTVRGILSDAELSRECMPFIGCIVFRQDTMDSLFFVVPQGQVRQERMPPETSGSWDPAVRSTTLTVWPEEDLVWGAYGMAEGAELTLTVDDPSTPNPVDYSESQVSRPAHWEEHGESFVSFDLWGVFDIRPGHRLSLSGHDVTVTYTVANLAVTEVNAGLDTISGVADPFGSIRVQITSVFLEELAGGGRDVSASSTGEWTADFSVPSDPPNHVPADPNEAAWEASHRAAKDIHPDTKTEVRQLDSDRRYATSVWSGSPQTLADDGRIALLEEPGREFYILAAGRSDAELAVIDERLMSGEDPGAQEITTAAEAAEDNKATADLVRSVTLVFGLVALAIGGLGIANTMQVLVRRRLPEAGVLKAIGLKGRQVMAVFLAEALIIAALGSVLGILIGVLFSFATVRLLEDLLFMDLEWILGAGPVVTGLVVGLVATLAFTVLPVVGAGRVRPLAAIRPNDSDLIKASWPISLLVLLGLALLAGVMVGFLIGSPVWGLAGTLGAFVVIGVLLAVLVAVVYLLSRLPTMRSLTLRLSFLEWRRRKVSAASTLLAMSIGVLGISLTLLFADTLTKSVSANVEGQIGADVYVLVNDPEEKEDAFAMMREAEGVAGFSPATVYDVTLVSHNGQIFQELGDPDQPVAHQDFGYSGANFLFEFERLTVREVDDLLPRLSFPPDGGGMLSDSDVGRNTLVLQRDEGSSAVEDLGLSVGDTVGLVGIDEAGLIASGVVEFEIVGFSAKVDSIVDIGVLTATNPFKDQPRVRSEAWGLVQVEGDERDELVRDLNLEFDSVFAYETSFYTNFYENLIGHFVMIPLILSGLSLVAAVVIIANAVALSTLERRREIGLLKAVGARSGWVVVQLAMENTVLGFVGGVIGVALSIAVLAIVGSAFGGGGLSLSISPVIVLGVLALTVVLSLSVTLISAIPAARARPLDVLRGE